MEGITFRGIRLSALNPKFLHTNSTSHTWPFSAIAELIDNAYDPDVGAKQLWIDKTRIRGQDCLTFTDNGAGMNYAQMFRMLSFGFSDKKAVKDHVPVGLYGNGFKSGSMRLGKDAIVFSRKGESMCVGMLSQSYLQEIRAGNILIPIVKFKGICHEPQHTASLKDILQYSLFQTKEELLAELEAIKAHHSSNPTGTRIFIWNLRLTEAGQSEFDFEADSYDIQISDDAYENESEKYKKSLREYCSVLYLKPRMQIIIRKHKVKAQLIKKSLACVAKDKGMTITLGFNPNNKEHYGVMMYHRSRLIKAYERVGCQNRANEKGVGVIAVVKCNFLKPTHNKQEFDFTEEYRKIMQALSKKVEEYWEAKHHEIGSYTRGRVVDYPKNPDQTWVQCDDCLKWRKLPDGIDSEMLPDQWFCHLNPDPEYRECKIPEEPEDSENIISCMKTYKEQIKNLKKQQEPKENKGPSSPKSHTATLTAAGSPVDSGPLQQSASGPSDSTSCNITEHTHSSSRRKRNLGRAESQTSKKARRLSNYCPSTSTVISDGQTSQIYNNEMVEKEDVVNNSDDDVVIVENNSTPKPQPPISKPAKIKLERSTSSDVHDSDHVSTETPSTEGTVKKEFSNKDVQTDPLEEQNYMTLYLEATQENEQLKTIINEMKEKEMLLQTKAVKGKKRMKVQGASPSVTTNVEDVMAPKVDFLLRELDQRNTECNELKKKLESLEQDTACCEQSWKHLEEVCESSKSSESSEDEDPLALWLKK